VDELLPPNLTLGGYFVTNYGHDFPTFWLGSQ
jgi:hypothetical protein